MNEYKITIEIEGYHELFTLFIADKNLNNFNLTIVGLKAIASNIFGDTEFVASIKRCDIDFVRIIQL